MSNIDFPNSPSNGDTYSYDGKQWTYDGEKWETSGGSKGQKGEPGPGAGDKGAKGEPGVGGSTGPSGNKGEKGESGPQGDVGPQGSAGAQGAAGPTGPQGEKGEASTVVGPTGPQGDTGATGPTGPAGSSGDKGDKGEVGAGTTQSLTLGANGNLSISGGNNVDLRQTQYLYRTTGDLPSASTYHGAIAHVHSEGALYFAHGGSWNKLANDSTAVSSSSETTFSADVNFDTGVSEKFSSLTGATGVVTHDCDNGHIFYHTSISADFTANFTNLGLGANYSTAITLILNQGVTPRVVSAVQIGGSAQTINWQGGSAPTGTANGLDAFSFTILRDGSSYIVLGQMVDFT